MLSLVPATPFGDQSLFTRVRPYLTDGANSLACTQWPPDTCNYNDPNSLGNLLI